MASKSGYALKHATGQQKMRYMNDFLELRETIRESKPTENLCPRCHQPMGSRPMFMIGKYDICFACYEAESAEAIRTLTNITDEAHEDYLQTIISGGEVLEISPTIVREDEIPY